MSSRTNPGGSARQSRLRASIAPKLIRDLAVLAGGQFVSKLIGLVVFALLARTLDPDGYGAVEYVVGLTALLAVAVDCGLGTIGVRRVAGSPEELPALAVQIPLARLVIALLAIPVMIIGVHALGPPGIPQGLVWLFAASLLFAAWNQDWLLQSAELMTHVAMVQTLRMVIFAVAVLLLVHDPADVTAVGWAEIAAAAVASMCYVVLQRAHVTRARITLSVSRMVGLVREGASLGLSQLVWAAASFTPLFLVGNLVGGADVGWFAAAQRLVTSISTFSFVYHFNLYPALARASAAGGTALAQLLRSSFRVTAWFGIGFALAITLAASSVLALIYGARFVVAAQVLAILVWVIPITFLSGHARWSLIVAGAQHRVLGAQIGGLATVAVSGVPLVLFLGDIGAAIAAVAGNITVWIVSHLYAARLPAPPPAFAPVAKPLLLAFVLGAALPLIELGPLATAIGGCALFAALAPLVDRALVPDLVLLAHAKAATATPPRT